MRLRIAAGLVLGLGAATANAGSVAADTSLLLRPQRVFDGTDEQAHEGWAVLVTGNRIAAVGPAASIAPPACARTIELAGMTLLPGLIDAHSHVFLHPYNETLWNDQVLKEPLAYRTIAATLHAERTLRAGFTTLRDLGTEGAGYADLSLKRAIDEGRIPGPRLLVATLAIVATASYGPGPLGFAPEFVPPKGAQEATGVAEVVRAVREQAGHGADWVKVYADYRRGPGGAAAPTFSLEELKALVDEAHSAGRPVAAHASTAEGMRRATLAGVQTIEHGYEGTEEVFRLMAERGVAFFPTLTAEEAYSEYFQGYRRGSEPWTEDRRHAERPARGAAGARGRRRGRLRQRRRRVHARRQRARARVAREGRDDAGAGAARGDVGQREGDRDGRSRRPDRAGAARRPRRRLGRPDARHRGERGRALRDEGRAAGAAAVETRPAGRNRSRGMKARWIACCVAFGLGIGLDGGTRGEAAVAQPEIGTRVARLLQVEGLLFKDLNKNGRLDPYEDWRRPVEERVSDLVSQMTLEEKAGLMVGPTLEMGPGGSASEQAIYRSNPFSGGPPVLYSPATSDAILRQHMRQFIDRSNADPRTMATWLNAVQAIAEGSRLGVPAFFVTNPRHHLSGLAQFGVNESAGTLSQWPGSLGLAATRDPALVEEFAAIAAREYVALGIRGAYHPQADLASEPRWARIDGTLGEDAKLTSELTRALVRGFQGKTLGPHSVALTVKHFPGGGPAREGLDPHFASGRFAVYPGGRFDDHVAPFRAAVEEGVAAVMPYYSIPQGRTSEPVGMAFNREIVTDLLRGRLGFTGIVNSDSGIMTAMAWGVETLSVKERYKKALDAGTDLIGSDGDPAVLVELVKSGALPEARLEESARRILRVRFALGIFENPYANPDEAARVVRSPESQAKADLAQRRSIVLLKNDKALLPLKPGSDGGGLAGL
jgi:beta-glucosidase